MKPTPNPIDEVLSTIAAAVEEWKVENSTEVIKQRVKELLDKESKKLTLKLLGFNESWGKWELDYCNGRNGNSPAGDYIHKVQQEAIQEWFKNMSMPKMSATLKKKLSNDIQKEFDCSLSRHAREQAHRLLESSLKTALEEIIPSNTIENFLKLQKIISSPVEESTK